VGICVPAQCLRSNGKLNPKLTPGLGKDILLVCRLQMWLLESTGEREARLIFKGIGSDQA
jgi:hypothetical protein